MLEVTGDIWDFHRQENWIVIPVNGAVKNNGEAVMGAGLALQAAQRFPELPKELGSWITDSGTNVYWHGYKTYIITFPTKHRNWRADSCLGLIEESAWSLKRWNDSAQLPISVYLPRLGCGERTGRLQWSDVKPILEQHLDDRFTVVSQPETQP